MLQVLIVAVLVAVAVAVSLVLRRRDTDAPEQGASWVVPTQLDRADFERPEAPWLVVVPGLAIMVTVFAFNLLGDGLRDALDPMQRGKG